MNISQELKKITSKKAFRFFHKKNQRNVFIAAVLLFVCLVLVVFIQKPQVLLQQASTGGPNNCAPVPYYCLILGSGKSCSKPPVCPTPIPSAGFVSQSNPNPKPASKPATPASASASPKGVLIMSNVTAHTNNGTGDYCLSASGDNANINQCKSSDMNEQWSINTNGTIINNGACLDVVDHQTTDGSKVVLDSCNGGKSQQWSVQTITSGPAAGQTEILNTNSDKCLGDPNFSSTNGNQQEIATCNGTDNLSWFTNPSALGSSLACTQNLSDNYYGGYLFPAPTANKLTVAGKWVVNSFTCKNGDNSYSQWPGIGNYQNGDLAQVGSYNMCNGTTATYNHPWTMAYPAPFVDPPASDIINVQDTMAASIQMTKPGTFTTVFSDKTQGWTYTRTMIFTGSNWTADYNGLVLEAEGNDAHASNSQDPIAPLPQFNDAYYENASYSLNGSANTSLSKASGLYCDDAEYQSGSNYIIQDNTSPIRNDNFYVTWLRGE